jgi:hypothetical protein
MRVTALFNPCGPAQLSSYALSVQAKQTIDPRHTGP